MQIIFDGFDPNRIIFQIFFNKQLLVGADFDNAELFGDKVNQLIRRGKNIVMKTQ